MKTIPLVLFTLFPICLMCQVKDSTKTSPSRFAIGLIFSSDYVYRNLNGGNANSQWQKQYRDTTEIGTIRYSAGINLAYKPSNKIAFCIGLIYSDKEYQTKVNDIYIVNWTGGGPRAILEKGTFYFTHNYLDIPVKASYYFLTNRIKAYMSAGISTNFLLKYSVLLKYSDGTTSTLNNYLGETYSSINLQACGGLGVSYDINTFMYATLEPDFMYSITSAGGSPFNEYLYSLGLSAGFYIRF